MYQDEFAHDPGNRRQRFLVNPERIAQQRQMRLEIILESLDAMRFLATTAGDCIEGAQFADAFIAGQNEGVAAGPWSRSSSETLSVTLKRFCLHSPTQSAAPG